MEQVLTINENDFEPQHYNLRKVVRLVILNSDSDKVLFFGFNLVGGGVEEGETDQDAIHREAMEEAGATVEIIRSLGEAVSYRDFLKKKYVVHGYLCRQLGKLALRTTVDPEEQKEEVSWLSIPDAVYKLESEISLLEQERSGLDEDDSFQLRIHNRKISLAFLKLAHGHM